MAATLEATSNRLPIYSLWSRSDAHWSQLDTSYSEAELRLKAEGLRRLFTTKQFLVVPGTMMPGG